MEELRTIKGFERYKISNKSEVFDTKRQKYLGTWVDSVGYRQCYLVDEDGKKHSKRIHRLLAIAFIDNPNNLPQVNHKDGNKLNNDIGTKENNYTDGNLEWISNKDNTQHGYNNGLYKFKTRSHAINVYRKNDHSFLSQYKSIRSMCEQLNLNRKTVTMILKGEKLTNNYDYEFEYAEESLETIENIT